MTNGKVAVLALGPAQAVEELGQWLHEGPRSARVAEVEVSEVEPQDWAHLSDFRTG